jgi:hypothetical protein
MKITDIANMRLINQQLTSSNFKTPKEIIGWMGAMQAQAYAMAKLAIGIRLPDTTDKIIQTAINNADIIRTHVLRPTWHFVSAEDIYWMLELTAPHVKAIMKSRNKQLELTETVFIKSNKIIEKALLDHKHLTREELMIKFKEAKINVDDNRGAHLLLHAELNGIICSGITKNKNQTYALLEERVPKTKQLNRDEALAKLAEKYFTSHGPATLYDFIWWSGLPVIDARHAFEMIKSGLVSEIIGSQTYWLSNLPDFSEKINPTALLLPAFDEFLISYNDRSAAINFEQQSRTFTNNGIFKPTIIINGMVAGTWKRTIKKEKLIIEASLFKPISLAVKQKIEKTAKLLGNFLDMKAEIFYIIN